MHAITSIEYIYIYLENGWCAIVCNGSDEQKV